MKRFLSFRRLSIIFAGVFALALLGVFALQRFWVDPEIACTRMGHWYDMETRICAQPIYIPDITKRPEGVTRAEASAAMNKDLVDKEAQLAAYNRARKAATEAERARVEALSKD